ncbi:SDR family NAD(P)-dependent oxidoreductase [Sphingobium sp. Sx8-8]|uniref:SDR family NAD(P)-dependent oxidoreductase n=1 Tax=Sphingobium sp. Sx8-8 TaxID=2933617 RepID=UPI001F5A3CBD|nr:SDR family NAD(P)-dependent oxidoreductase [Sphingobium sp. Sx8-8]
MKTVFRPVRILIIGASGGLGTALARHYARPDIYLSLWGRDTERLSSLSRVCEAAGASVHFRSLDLSDLKGGVDAMLAEDERTPFDLAIFASGLGDVRATGAVVEDAALVARLGIVNFVAPASMAAALAGRMAARGKGRIVLIGSAAAFHALPFACAYSGTKAGLSHFAEALRIGMRQHGVGIVLVSPGFIDTQAARQAQGSRPLSMSPEVAAAKIARAAALGKAHVITPWPFSLLRWFDRLLPRPLRERLLLALAPPGG